MTDDNSKSGKLNFTVGLEPFCFKQFDTKGANHIPCEKQEFLNKLRELLVSGNVKFTSGYAPFCKHLFIKNFTDAICGTLEITRENEHLLRSGYNKRTDYELPVLERWFPLEKVQHLTTKAKYLDVILYSSEQVKLEYDALGLPMCNGKGDGQDYDYYVVAIKAQANDVDLPMQPITMWRNTLICEGGSGVALDREKYLKSVDFWSKHALISQH